MFSKVQCPKLYEFLVTNASLKIVAEGVNFSEDLGKVHSALEANLPVAVEIAPFVVWYNGDTAIVPNVEISNMSACPLLIQSHQLV